MKKLVLLFLLSISSVSFSIEPYKVYTAIIYQDFIENPVVYVLENDIGPIDWSRLSDGYYLAHLDDAFPLNHTWITISGDLHCSFLYGSDSDLIVITRNIFGSPEDGVMFQGAYIEIRVYPFE